MADISTPSQNPPPGASAGLVLTLDRPLVLVGLMGAGKTSIGQLLAQTLELSFVDSDQEIERAATMSVAEIFELYGEAEFRALEQRVLKRLINEPPQVIATGGGAFINPETRQLIKSRAVSIWLDADVDVLVERTARRTTRPLLLNTDPRLVLQRLRDERAPFYREADLKVVSGTGPQRSVVGACIKALEGWQKIAPVPGAALQ